MINMRSKPLLLMMGLFFICGLGTVMNHILIPYFQIVWQFNYTSVMCIQFSFFLGYSLFSPFAGFVIRGRFVKGMRLGALLGGISAEMIAFTSLQGYFFLTLFSIFCMGGAIAVMQVCLNPYVLHTHGRSTLTIAQSATGVGMFLAPLIGAKCFLAGLCEGLSPGSLFTPYLLMGFVWFFLGFFLLFLQEAEEHPPEHVPFKADSFLLIGFIGIALSVGIETTLASYIVRFLSDPEILDLTLESAGYLSMVFWFTLILGRGIGGLLLLKRDMGALMRNYALSGCFISALVIYSQGYVSGIAVLLLGFSVSILFPLIFASVIEKSREKASHASGILCMGNIGGAAIPFIQGIAADTVGLQLSFLIPMICFLLLSHPKFRCNPHRAVTPV